MKNMTFAIALSFASLLPAYSQTPANLKTTIPFDFVVAGKTLDAGSYQLQPTNYSHVTLIRSDSGNSAVFAVTSDLTPGNGESDPTRLVFHRYGDTYFLSQIWTESTAQELPESKMERRMLAHDGVPEEVSLTAGK